MKKTKIIATLGPASFTKKMIRNLIISGMDVARINMSHEIEKGLLQNVIQFIREEAQSLDKSIAIMFDLCGPKIRVGKLNKSKSIKIEKGKTYTLGYKGSDITMNMPLTFTDKIGNGMVKINDGAISFDIMAIKKNKLTLCSQTNGVVVSGKGINFPGIKLNLPSVTDKDINDLELAIELEADWIAMSFVRSSRDIRKVKSICKKNKSSIPIIAKIEKPEAIQNLEGIIAVFDGILVARGDLGVEMPIRELPILQKRIVNECLKQHKPVIIATQMLETMMQSKNPTRAEVNDIANAIYDGVDAVMLSGETAIGKFPVESIEMMAKIANSVDEDLDMENFNRYIQREYIDNQDQRGSICHAAMTLADDLSVENIIIMTESGQTSIKMAQYRPKAKVYAFCCHKHVFHMLSIIWGITPVLVESFQSTDEMIQSSGNILRRKKYLVEGEKYIITSGAPVGVAGTTNMIKIHQA